MPSTVLADRGIPVRAREEESGPDRGYDTESADLFGRPDCSQNSNPLGALAVRAVPEPSPDDPHKSVRRGQEQ